MKFILIFISPNKTTEKTAFGLKKIIENQNNEVNMINIGEKKYRDNFDLIIKELETADIVGFGSPVYHMDILKPLVDLLEKFKSHSNNFTFKAFLFINYAGITTGKALINTACRLRKINVSIIGGIKIVAPHFHHDENFPDKIDLEIIKEFFIGIQEKKFSEIEWSKIKVIFSQKKKIVNILYPFVHLIGKKRELPIEILNEKCKKCRKCINECPVDAIKFNQDNELEISLDKCLHCYHCVIACPFEAIKSPIEKLDKMIGLNKKIIGIEIPGNKIYI